LHSNIYGNNDNLFFVINGVQKIDYHQTKKKQKIKYFKNN